MNRLLLPYRWKLAGIFLLMAGTVSAIFYIWFDFRFKVPVFAVYSSFLETKLFSVFRTNFSEELTLLLLISGLSLVIFSKEKNEFEGLDLIRSRALFKALAVNNILLFLSVLLIYGSGFIAILVINIFSFFIFYLLFFYLGKRMKV
jgi:hypothetical protein